jgi:hypothetical protein
VVVVVEERKVFLGFRPVSGGYHKLGEMITGASLPHRITSILKYNHRLSPVFTYLFNLIFFPKFFMLFQKWRSDTRGFSPTLATRQVKKLKKSRNPITCWQTTKTY